jgi:hypothetical protein
LHVGHRRVRACIVQSPDSVAGIAERSPPELRAVLHNRRNRRNLEFASAGDWCYPCARWCG